MATPASITFAHRFDDPDPITKSPNVMIVSDSGSLWSTDTERDFYQSSDHKIRYRRAKCYVRVREIEGKHDTAPVLLQGQYTFDPELLRLLGPEALAETLARQIVEAAVELTVEAETEKKEEKD